MPPPMPMGGAMPPGGGGPLAGLLPRPPTVGPSDELVRQLQGLGTEVAQIGALFLGRGMADAAIACGKAVKELEKVPDLVDRGQQVGPPPPLGGPGMPGGGMFPSGPPRVPGMPM